MRPPRRYLPKGALALGSGAALTVIASVIVLSATVLAGGCGTVEYLNQVSSKAASAVSAAKLAQADHYAPYEYTAAEEYLHKAREEASYSQYQDAIEYGRRSEELANRARAISVARLSQSAGPSAGATPATEAPKPLQPGRDPE